MRNGQRVLSVIFLVCLVLECWGVVVVRDTSIISQYKDKYEETVCIARFPSFFFGNVFLEDQDCGSHWVIGATFRRDGLNGSRYRRSNALNKFGSVDRAAAFRLPCFSISAFGSGRVENVTRSISRGFIFPPAERSKTAAARPSVCQIRAGGSNGSL